MMKGYINNSKHVSLASLIFKKEKGNFLINKKITHETISILRISEKEQGEQNHKSSAFSLLFKSFLILKIKLF